MRRALAVIMAILVSIIWLGMIVGVPVLAATGQLERWVPVDQLQQLIEGVGVDTGTLTGLLPDELLALLPPDVAGEPAVVVVETATSTPEPPTPTPPLPTETPTPEPTPSPIETPTPEPEPEVDETDLITDTVGITDTLDLTTTVELTPTFEIDVTLPQTATVAGIANVRSGPGTDFDIVGTIDADAVVSIIARDEESEWFLLEDGTWIFGALLAEVPDVPVDGATPPATAEEVTPTAPEEATPPAEAPLTTLPTITTTVTSDANLRLGPGTTYNVAAGVTAGTVITLAGRNVTGTWYLLETGNWVSATLLAAVPENLPIVNEQGIIVTGPNAGQNVISSQTTPAGPAVTETEPTPAAVQPTTNAAANLRAGPGTTFNVVGSAPLGTQLNIVGRNAAGDWFRLSDGSWIFSALVANPPANLPVTTP
ncbi:MAG: SH3 domain-containing protein [Caldilineaceae bacterium]|nr:SH3 domain-containing protein [Caldilineaceae bacterium]